MKEQLERTVETMEQVRLESFKSFLDASIPNYDGLNQEVKNFLLVQMDAWHTIETVMAESEYSILKNGTGQYTESQTKHYLSRIKKALVYLNGDITANSRNAYGATTGRFVPVNPIYENNKQSIDKIIESI